MGTEAHNKNIIQQLLSELQDTAMKKNFVTMCKDDRIFICLRPIKPEELLWKNSENTVFTAAK